MAYLDAIINSGIGAKVVLVTPDLADRILTDHNRGNRRVKPSVVQKYARMMANGEWRLSPETISVSNTGRLLNGQHRMLAVKASGVPCEFLFAFGFDDDVFEVLDRGATRTVADALSIDRKIIQVAAIIARASSPASGSVPDSDIARAAKCVAEVHEDLMSYCPSAVKLFSSAPFRLGCIARVMSGERRDYCFGLYRDLVLGHTENLPPIGHNIIRVALRGRAFVGSGGAQQMAATCTAWDVFGEGMRNRSRVAIKFDIETMKRVIRATGYVHA